MESVYEEMYDKLKREFDQYKKESIKWSVEDFTSFEVDGEEITDDDAQSALEEMIDKHDCNYGITWNTIDYYYHLYSTIVPVGEEQWRKDLIKKQHSNGN